MMLSKKMAGLRPKSSLLTEDSLEPTAVHFFPSSASQQKDLVLVGDKAGQVSLFDFEQKSKLISPVDSLKPEGIIEISCMEHLTQGPFLLVGRHFILILIIHSFLSFFFYIFSVFDILRPDNFFYFFLIKFWYEYDIIFIKEFYIYKFRISFSFISRKWSQSWEYFLIFNLFLNSNNSGNLRGNIFIKDIHKKKTVFKAGKHNAKINCLKPFSTYPNLFLSGSLDSNMKLWDVRQAQEVKNWFWKKIFKY